MPRIYPVFPLFMIKEKWHYTLSWRNGLSDAFKNIYTVLGTSPCWFMIIDAAMHMQ